MLRAGQADFCELLADNFLHVAPATFREALGDLPRAEVLEPLAAAAARWSRTDLTADLGLLVASDALPGEGILAWKCLSLDESKRGYFVQREGLMPIGSPAAWIPLAARGDVASLAAGRPWCLPGER